MINMQNVFTLILYLNESITYCNKRTVTEISAALWSVYPEDNSEDGFKYSCEECTKVRQENKHKRDADDGVHDTKRTTSGGDRSYVTVTYATIYTIQVGKYDNMLSWIPVAHILILCLVCLKRSFISYTLF